MERRGIMVNQDKIAEVYDFIAKEQKDIRQQYPESENVNLRSAIQLKDYFEYFGITDWPLTDKGNPSFNKDWLAETPQGEAILLEKRLLHFVSNFLEPLQTRHAFNGVVHTTFNQTRSDDYGTVTGRLSSSNPNMQQTPKRDKFIGRLFRSLFIAREGFYFEERDYSQCEPRLYAHYSEEPRLVEGYRTTPAIDMHAIVQEMMGLTRDRAKTINLGILYMMGIAKLARQLRISMEEAEVLFLKWYALFPKVTKFRKTATAVGEQRGFVRTILGRRRRFPDPRYAYKSANAIIQGGAADVLKYKIVEVHKFLRTLPRDTVHMLLNIHDALLFEVQDSDLGREALVEANRILVDVQSKPFELIVPFATDFGRGRDWATATYGPN
jgi:DNA polymerase-1